MLNRKQLTDLFDRLGTPEAGRRLILDSRVQAPVRDVQSRGGNVITLMASRKMGCEIATESRHIEFAAAIDHEFDPKVLEFYAQPCKLQFELIDDSTGEIRNITHYPDFLLICHDGLMLEEWKSEAKLAGLAEKYPYRYVRDVDGNWRSPQIETQLGDLGIRYRICTERSVPRRRVENFLALADYFHPAAEPCPDDVLARLQVALNEHGALFFSELLTSPYHFVADQLNYVIAHKLVSTDLDNESLAEPRRFRLYRDDMLLEFMRAEVQATRVPGLERFAFNPAAGTRFEYEGRELTIVIAGEKSVVCNDADGQSIELKVNFLLNAHENERIRVIETAEPEGINVGQYSRQELEEALRRMALLETGDESRCSARSQRRWAAMQREAEANGGRPILALVPRTSARGNRKSRLTRGQAEMLERTYSESWDTSEAKNYKVCHQHLVVICDEAGIKAPSYPTLIKFIDARATPHNTRKRHGKRLAYQESGFIDVLYFDTPKHGSRPLQYVHIDHTLVDIELVSSRTGKPLGKPWLSLAVDAYSRRIVGIYLTYDPPSYHSVMMVIRDIVRRFHRLPEFIVVDNGTDFRSHAFEAFLMAMGTHLRFRPAGQPRHGAMLERMFGRLNLDYIHNLAGNTKDMKNVRSVSRSHLPKNLAEWTIEELYYGIQSWATEYYDQNIHPALGESPRDAFQRGLRESGSRAHMHIQYNRDFLIATCPPVDRTGTRKVDAQRGVKVNDYHYWHPDFRLPQIAGQRFPVRYDPWDAASVYVRVKNQWLHATCRNLHGLGQLTEFERRAMTEEYLNRTGASLNDDKAVQRLREFMAAFTPEGVVAIALERQAEAKSLYGSLLAGSITPVPPKPKFGLADDVPDHTDVQPDAAQTSSPQQSSAADAAAWGDLTDLDEF
ncbi:DDE-type integrase/transposase/recombinase [Burkholderia vietnamiensis]|uniref:DDE-type integrase/transposase/recombinase n=1 Tax=Burkholderia vietnamiensis TaxID=60552 RepID=UPI00075CD778|nr:DDE-type integrase/transposase/recombinase [Burkholderia vietnamiensis]KVE73687.1 integrase [Burkholderia vietnamiensis]